MKKLILSLSALILSCSLLTSCGQNTNTSTSADLSSSVESSAFSGIFDLPNTPAQVEDYPVMIMVGEYREGEEPEFIEVYGSYTGALLNGLPDGEGAFSSENEAGVAYTYTGSFIGGAPNGKGSTVWVDENDQVNFAQFGTYINGLYAPTKAERIYSLGQFSGFGTFNVSEAGFSFIEQNKAIFPAGSADEIKDFVNPDASIKKIKKSISGYEDSLMKVKGLYVVQIVEEFYAGDTVTTMLLADSVNNFFCVYYPGSIDYYQGDTIDTAYILPLANTGFSNVSGGTTLCLAAYGSYID